MTATQTTRHEGVVVQNFRTEADAENAVRALRDAGFTADEISVVAQDRDRAEGVAGGTGEDVAAGTGIGAATGGVLAASAGCSSGQPRSRFPASALLWPVRLPPLLARRDSAQSPVG